MEKTTYIVHFRTRPHGGWKWIKRGQRLGWWRVLEVQNPQGCIDCRSHNVRRIVWEGSLGIDGVTPRSSYYIGDEKALALEIAEKENVQQATLRN